MLYSLNQTLWIGVLVCLSPLLLTDLLSTWDASHPLCTESANTYALAAT